MSESFASLLEESLATIDMKPGAIISGIVFDVDDAMVTVHVGLKSEGLIPLEEFRNDGSDEIKIGDEVKVVMEAVDDGWGATRLSREKARREEVWELLEHAHDDGVSVEGVISGKVKGGYTVEVQTVRTFLPGSLLDIRPMRDITHLENQTLEFKVIKIDRKRNNVVVSRRAVLEIENNEERTLLLETLEEGQVRDGVVKNLTDYGAFVDLGGVDGLLHITDMVWRRIRHPDEVVKVGDRIRVKILKFDKEDGRVSLGLKQLDADPWLGLAERYPVGSQCKARVTHLVEYGCFAEIAEGVEGLVHVSEMDWTSKNILPSKVVSVNDEVDVMILEIDENRRRISLGIKQCKLNPWEDFAARNKIGDKITGEVKSVTDFGVFLGLGQGIDGLVHVTDLSWNEAGEEAVKQYSQGQVVEALVLGIDSSRERISLGIKQLQGVEFNEYVANNGKGDSVSGVVETVFKKEAVVRLAEGVKAILKVSETDNGYIEDLRTKLAVGEPVDAKIINVDMRRHLIQLSVKAWNQEQEYQSLSAQHAQQNQQKRENTTTIGSLIRKEIEQGDSKK